MRTEHPLACFHSSRGAKPHTDPRVQPEHGDDQLPGEREDAEPDAGNGDGLHELVKLVIGEFWTEHNGDTPG